MQLQWQAKKCANRTRRVWNFLALPVAPFFTPARGVETSTGGAVRVGAPRMHKPSSGNRRRADCSLLVALSSWRWHPLHSSSLRVNTAPGRPRRPRGARAIAGAGDDRLIGDDDRTSDGRPWARCSEGVQGVQVQVGGGRRVRRSVRSAICCRYRRGTRRRLIACRQCDGPLCWGRRYAGAGAGADAWLGACGAHGR